MVMVSHLYVMNFIFHLCGQNLVGILFISKHFHASYPIVKVIDSCRFKCLSKIIIALEID